MTARHAAQTTGFAPRTTGPLKGHNDVAQLHIAHEKDHHAAVRRLDPVTETIPANVPGPTLQLDAVDPDATQALRPILSFEADTISDLPVIDPATQSDTDSLPAVAPKAKHRVTYLRVVSCVLLFLVLAAIGSFTIGPISQMSQPEPSLTVVPDEQIEVMSYRFIK